MEIMYGALLLFMFLGGIAIGAGWKTDKAFQTIEKSRETWYELGVERATLDLHDHVDRIRRQEELFEAILNDAPDVEEEINYKH